MARPSAANAVDVDLIAGVVDASGKTLAEVCHNLQWYDSRGLADTSRLQRRIGRLYNSSTYNGKKYKTKQKTLHYTLATQIVTAAGFDPVEVGL